MAAIKDLCICDWFTLGLNIKTFINLYMTFVSSVVTYYATIYNNTNEFAALERDILRVLLRKLICIGRQLSNVLIERIGFVLRILTIEMNIKRMSQTWKQKIRITKSEKGNSKPSRCADRTLNSISKINTYRTMKVELGTFTQDWGK